MNKIILPKYIILKLKYEALCKCYDNKLEEIKELENKIRNLQYDNYVLAEQLKGIDKYE